MKTRGIIAALGALTLAGCISFGAEPPPSLLTLTPDTAVPIGQPQSSAAARSITVAVPTTPQALAATRVPVQATPTTLAYVKEAVWAEPPARLFARLVADTLTARSGLVVLSPAQSISDPGARLGGELRNFGLDATQRVAIVTYDASLVRTGATTVEKRRFEARVPVATIDAATAGPALNQAANQVAVEVTDWVGR
ncbi:MAG TPA: ABC-type transport auxiliary lipoprotein family protein [Sphingomonas sp.]|jgi:cholesterol transport system auxiliary component